jgi:hypothetical protein
MENLKKNYKKKNEEKGEFLVKKLEGENYGKEELLFCMENAL